MKVNFMNNKSKYSLNTQRTSVPYKKVANIIKKVMAAYGCNTTVCESVSEHLIHSDWSGVESHGSWRIIQYANYYKTGYLNPKSIPKLDYNDRGATIINGNDAIGIPAMELATNSAIKEARENGISAIAIKDVGHTGRLGAFTEKAANNGMLMIIIGGGGRKNWRLVAPYGGAEPLMSTNPYSIGIPGGNHGPVVMDFATSAIAAGWVYGAKISGASLPDNVLVDKRGNPTNNPQDYFDGGAILPAGGVKGYAMAIAAEMIAEALLGPVKTECNWLVITLDCSLYQESSAMQATAEEILSELRNSRPAKGFDRVEIPGERERSFFKKNAGKAISLPLGVWTEMLKLADEHKIS